MLSTIDFDASSSESFAWVLSEMLVRSNSITIFMCQKSWGKKQLAAKRSLRMRFYHSCLPNFKLLDGDSVNDDEE